MPDQSLPDKLSYLDFLMYVLPGSIGIGECIIGAALVSPKAVEKLHLFGEGGLLVSIVFLISSFVMGNAIQAFAHTLPERMLRLIFWSRYWPSQLALFEGGPCLSSAARSQVMAALHSMGLLDDQQARNLNIRANRKWGWWRLTGTPEQRKVALDEAQTVFYRAKSFLSEANAGQKALIAESYFQFFRGLFTAVLLGAICFALLGSMVGWKVHLGLPAGATSGARPIAVLCLVLMMLFGWRTRGTGQGFVREVYLAISIVESAKKRISGAIPPSAS